MSETALIALASVLAAIIGAGSNALHQRSQARRADKLVERLSATSGDARTYAGHSARWAAFWEMLLRFKDAAQIVNTATALVEIIRIVTEHLDALQAQAAGSEQCA